MAFGDNNSGPDFGAYAKNPVIVGIVCFVLGAWIF